MRLVEAVARERLDEREDLLGQLLVEPVGDAAVDELLAVDGDLVFLLLPHDLAQLVGLPHREAGEIARDLHDLFLIQRCRYVSARIGLELRMQVRRLGGRA